jgi:ribokinase
MSSVHQGSPYKRIVVLGSLNIDLVQRVPRIPVAGETLIGGNLETYAGGKGANQACAAALLGGQVAMAGMVGQDVFSDRLLAELKNAGVDTKSVHKADTSSGTAVIFVMPNGENSIVISPGANGEVTGAFALQAIDGLQAGDFLLCQLETPMESVITAMKAAHVKGVTTILDPAPAHGLPEELLRATSILTPNQTEAGFLTYSTKAIETMAQAADAARQLRNRGTSVVIVKMGPAGCLIADGGQLIEMPGFPVEAVDTTAAGDTFNGALAVGLAEGMNLMAATQFANAAAALSVTKPGAIASMPTRRQVDQFFKAARSRV